jgi:hypothetical protein
VSLKASGCEEMVIVVVVVVVVPSVPSPPLAPPLFPLNYLANIAVLVEKSKTFVEP